MRPDAYVFSGPTLAHSDYVAPEGVAFLPPAAQGDVYRAARKRPRAIGIIDGYFEGQASIWHKEILWAIDQGIHVFGSASMGALRAAELHQFGMQGVGKIFEAYRDGELEDDDEVAVLHAPADAGFLALSDPMVNIRATLAEAMRQAVIDAAASDRLESLAKQTFYQERRWSDLLAKAEREGMDATALAAIKSWLTDHRVDQKAIDAVSMIEAIGECLGQDSDPLPVNYYFEWTEMWDEVVKNADAPSDGPSGADEAISEAVLDELGLEAGAFDPLYRLALLRKLKSTDHPSSQSRRRISQAITAFRARHGLYSRADLDIWLQQHHLTADDFEQLMANDTAIEDDVIDRFSEMSRHLLDQLRLDGRYRSLAERAAAKRALLESIGQTDPESADISLSPPELRAWYFERRRREPIPEDLERYARAAGFKNCRSFDRALRREYLYVMNQER